MTDCLVHDKDSRLIIDGERTSKHQPDYRKLADDMLERIGKGKTEYGRIGGGALSGKDPSKVDRSAAYMPRKIARNIV